ncbi:LysR family transcriptional regulator [Comamonas testosteroni]|uniref:LysR family transcriptional regulator n=1 Tax=Comamonas testosteroni TaxID=285 RepID=UPI00389A6BB1
MLSRRELLLLRAMYLHGTVTAAAAAIPMSQPAASALLRDMEIRLGFALFSREQRRLHLTSQGRALIPEVLNALSGMEAVDRLASDIRKSAAARLTIGAVAVASSMLLPSALVAVRRAFPEVAFTLRAGTAMEIVDMAVDHRIDLGVVIANGVSIGERVHRECIAALSLYAVFHPGHPCATSSEPLTLETASELGLIVLSPMLPAGLATQQSLLERGLPYRPLMEVTQSFTACELAGQQLGIAIVETLGARYAQRQGLCAQPLVTLNDSELTLIHPNDKPMNTLGLTLRSALLKAAHEHMK